MRSLRTQALVLAGLAVLASLVALSFRRSDAAAGSSLSRGPYGWLVARRYVEERGATTRLLDRGRPELAAGERLVIVFPWQRGLSREPGRAAQEHLRRGGTVVVGYTGRAYDFVEAEFFELLGIAMRRVKKPAIDPWRFRRDALEEWELLPESQPPASRPGRVRRTELLPRLPTSARILYRSREGEALVARLSVGRGELLLLPAEALCNARLHEPGHGQLLETVLTSGLGPWAFDEYHHGLAAPLAEESRPLLRAFDYWIAHAVLLYLLALLALVRRFGPAWRDPPVTTGSARTFFMGIGTLASRLGGRREAAELLSRRARELDPRLDLSPLGGPGSDDDAAFLEYARAVARAQQGSP